jgi:hypothetical protein
MTVRYHRAFPKDIQRFLEQYERIGATLRDRLKREITDGIEQIKCSPNSAGHFVNTGSTIVQSVRRYNLRKFPLFIVYSFDGEKLFFGAVVPSRSDPLLWLARWRRGTSAL